MYVNGKMRPVKTIAEVGGGGLEDKDGRGELKYEAFGRG
jgi:hypothetical protein